MKLYRAETGCSVQWTSNSLKDIETLEQLYQTIEQHTRISPENQILMTSYGNIVKKDNVQQVIHATGDNEYLVFCYNREYLSANPTLISELLAKEIPKLQSEILVFDGLTHLKQIQQSLNKKTVDENCDSYAMLFQHLGSYSESLMEAINTHALLASKTVQEQKIQTMALSVALENLKSHIGSGTKSVQVFIETAKKELTRQNGLIKSLASDINILRHTSIHQSILEMLEPVNQSKLKLLDFVDVQHINSIKSESVDLYNYLKQKTYELHKVTQELANHERELLEHVAQNSNLQSLDASLSDIKSIASTAQECNEDVNKSLPKVEDTINKLKRDPISIAFSNLSINTSSKSALGRRDSSPSQTVSLSTAKRKFDSLNHLAIYQLEDPIHKLMKYDAIVRQHVSDLVASKRTSISEFFMNMSVVSDLQECIANLEKDAIDSLNRLDQFKKKYGRNDLESVRQVAFSYGALLIELVRRKEYRNILVKNSTTLADLLADYRTEEEKRREHFRRIISKSLPFKLTGLEKPSPQIEITLNGANNHNETALDKQDITEFISLLNTVYFQPMHASLSKRPSFISPSSSSSNRKSMKSSRTEDSNILVFLDAMFTQLNEMKSDFLMAIETSFFTPNKINPLLIKELLQQEERYQVPTSESKLKITASSSSNSTDSSTFSVVDDDKNLILAMIEESNEIKERLVTAHEQAKAKSDRQEQEINQLKHALAKVENEKEDFESQIQKLDQLVQTLEQNRKSFINELKNKDKSVDFRIASAEEDFQSKIADLQFALEEERRMKKNLEIEHNSELNSLQLEHAAEIENLKASFAEQKQNLQNEKCEVNRRVEQLAEDLAAVKGTLESERLDHEEAITQKQLEIDEREKAISEIKPLQEKAKLMIKRAQNDWCSKNEELQKQKLCYETLERTVRSLLERFTADDSKDINYDLQSGIITFQESLEGFTKKYNDLKSNFEDVKDLLYRFRKTLPKPEDSDLKSDIKAFRESLELFIQDYHQLQDKFKELTEELSNFSSSYKNITDEHEEWRTIGSHMAEKLEEYRKNVIYELVLKLQLPMDEGELNILSRNLTPSDDDSAIWNQILQLSSSVSNQKVVIRILEKAKSQYDMIEQMKAQYKTLKDKYRRLCHSSSEKISFRNFKVGDVALFLPTRNSTGKPWAAFNINAPHYFLNSDDTTSTSSKEWIVARIVSITENVANENNADSNPYALAHGLKYYTLQVENWRASRPSQPKNKKRVIEPDSGLASLASPTTIVSTSPPQKRPSFSSAASTSSNNIVHSYVNK